MSADRAGLSPLQRSDQYAECIFEPLFNAGTEPIAATIEKPLSALGTRVSMRTRAYSLMDLLNPEPVRINFSLTGAAPSDWNA